eukprot:5991704-Alexandrium_andersonii.AAC.1
MARCQLGGAERETPQQGDSIISTTRSAPPPGGGCCLACQREGSTKESCITSLGWIVGPPYRRFGMPSGA